ncbi:MAG: hypothetical protein ACR2LQ_13810 [Acidimicrobiales bacterium]
MLDDVKGDGSVDLQGRRELNQGFGDSLARAFELVLTPVLMGAIGWFVDSRIGTKPFVALGLFLFTVVYLFWKLFARYDSAMKAKEAELFGRGRRT